MKMDNTRPTYDVVREVYSAMLAAAPAAPTHVPEADFGNISDLLPGTYYMDPPDGGSVTLREQFERMAKDAERYRWLKHECDTRGSRGSRIVQSQWGLGWDGAIDAAIAASKKGGAA